MLSLRVTYARVSELRNDVEGQLVRGGMLVRVSPIAEMQLHTQVTLEIVTPDGQAVRGEGEIIHVQPGHGVAVTFPAAQAAELRALLGPDRPDRQGAAPALHELVSGPPPAAAPAPEKMSTADRIQLALHGSRDDRAAILRDRNRMAHSYVLKNPQVTPEEVLAIAKSALSAPELLQQIAERKEWLQRGQIAIALARNPKTPQGTGLRALEFVPMPELRQLAKGIGAPPHIVQGARKKVLKP